MLASSDGLRTALRGLLIDTPPSPRSIGIMASGGNQKQDLGLQQLSGKILSLKELLSAITSQRLHPQYGGLRFLSQG